MRCAVIIKRGHGAADEGTRHVEAASTLEALRGELEKLKLGGKLKPGTYLSAVAFVVEATTALVPGDGEVTAVPVAVEEQSGLNLEAAA